MNSRETALLESAHGLRNRQLEWTRRLIAIPTVNPYSGDASAGSEREGQDWFAAQCRAVGGRVRRVPVPDDVYQRAGMIGSRGRSWRDRDNVVAEWIFGHGGPTIILNTHIDTVGTDGMQIDPFDPRIDNGRLYGRGSSDSKGNLIVGLTAVAALLEDTRGLNGSIILESVIDEECNGAGAGTLACCQAGIDADFSICLDGIAGIIHNGCNGVATPRLTVYGQAGHAALGVSVNAIDKAFKVKQAIDRFAEQHLQAFPDCRVNLGVFRSGTLAAIVPADAEMQLNISYAVADARRSEESGAGWNGTALRSRFEAMLKALGNSDPWFRDHPVAVEWIKDVYPFYVEADDAFSKTAIQAFRDLSADPAATAHPMPAWFDACHLSRVLGKPVLGIGSGTAGCAHGANEYVEIESLYQGTRIIALALQRLCSQPNG